MSTFSLVPLAVKVFYVRLSVRKVRSFFFFFFCNLGVLCGQIVVPVLEENDILNCARAPFLVYDEVPGILHDLFSLGIVSLLSF